MHQWGIKNSTGAIASFNYLNCWIWWSDFFFLLIILIFFLKNSIFSLQKKLFKKIKILTFLKILYPLRSWRQLDYCPGPRQDAKHYRVSGEASHIGRTQSIIGFQAKLRTLAGRKALSGFRQSYAHQSWENQQVGISLSRGNYALYWIDQEFLFWKILFDFHALIWLAHPR